MRPPRSYFVFASWFAFIGPFVVTPVPVLLLGAHITGFIPGVLTGLALAYRYRHILTPVRLRSRIYSGIQAGATVTFFCAVLAAIGIRWIDTESVSLPIRMYIEESVKGTMFISLIGSIAGAFAFALMPAGLRDTDIS